MPRRNKKNPGPIPVRENPIEPPMLHLVAFLRLSLRSEALHLRGPTSRGFAALQVFDLASRPSALGFMGRFVDRLSLMPAGLERTGEVVEACRVVEGMSCQRVVACPRFTVL